ncbi:MAG TPA: hypothetical protein VMW95_06640 [Desulfobacterales bacterium]|nr:hypothetical protein [Desulfobacterales bacterium]
MTDIISKEDFKKGMKRLEAAFIKTPTKETIEIYYEKLKNIKKDNFLSAVEEIIETENFFPSIALFKKTLPNNYDPVKCQPPLEDVLS